MCGTLTLEGSIMTVGTKLRKMWLQSVRTLVLLKATSSSSMASSRRRSPSFWRYSKEASCLCKIKGFNHLKTFSLNQGINSWVTTNGVYISEESIRCPLLLLRLPLWWDLSGGWWLVWRSGSLWLQPPPAHEQHRGRVAFCGWHRGRLSARSSSCGWAPAETLKPAPGYDKYGPLGTEERDGPGHLLNPGAAYQHINSLAIWLYSLVKLTPSLALKVKNLGNSLCSKQRWE